jgi:hypothetical protein
MSKQTKVVSALLGLGAFGMLGLGLGLGLSNPTRALDQQEKAVEKLSATENQSAAENQQQAKKALPEKAAPAGMDITPPPPELNDLILEVAALRTLYLLNSWPDHNNGSWKYHTNAPWYYIQQYAQKNPPNPPEKPKDLNPPVVSDKYKKVLIELRAAYIAGQDDRIIDLTDQLDELAEDEDVDIVDSVEHTPNGRKNALLMTPRLTPECVVNYLNSYGKGFPSPYNMIGKVIIERQPGQKIPADTRLFVMKEVGWALAGFHKDPPPKDKIIKDNKDVKTGEIYDKAAEIEKRVGAILDKASGMSPEDARRAWSTIPTKGVLREDYDNMKDVVFGKDRHFHPNSFHLLEHLMQQDMADLFSNPRLLPAIEARDAYLKKAGFDTKANPDN